jgi:4-diphosphocytidyl-2-C-methyl-D-erythritol kinase
MTVVELAPAKINLSLEVVGRRADGFHELTTVLQTIGLADELSFDEADELSLACDDPSLAVDGNLVLRAARVLGGGRGARIHLRKRIPVAAGLGGGSSDAAATLRGLVRLWGLRIGDAELLRTAAALGADVPFLVRGGTALATGLGDELEALPDAPSMWVVLYLPEPGPADKTARAYRALQPAHFSDGRLTRELASWIWAGAPLRLARWPNTFERVADALYPSLLTGRARLMDAGAPWVRLAGAGPTLVTIVDDRSAAEAIASRLDAPEHAWCVPTHPRLG